jgi:glucose/arabinose dehydrogenase
MTFAGATAAVWSSGCPTVAPSGAAFISGSEWGTLDGQLVMAVLKDRHLRFVRMDGNTVVGTAVAVTDRGRLRAAHMGPDGYLWVAQDSSSGSILKVGPL